MKRFVLICLKLMGCTDAYSALKQKEFYKMAIDNKERESIEDYKLRNDNFRYNAMKTIILILTFLATQLTRSIGQTTVAQPKQANTTNDTTYIPIDLDDCIQQLDNLFADSSKVKIKTMTESEFSARMHLNFGMWMRNNWGLWKGSRLSMFFNEKGIYHPDDMSGIILDSYYRYLTGQEIKIAEQIKYYQGYWETAKKQELKRRREEYANYNIGDTVLFNYRNHFVSKAQEDKYNNNICTAKGIITAKNDEKFFIKIKLIVGCDKKGIISYDSEGSLVYNKSTKKMEKPQKRVVTYMKVGDESWFNYSDWETND